MTAADRDIRFHEEWLGLAQPIEGLVFSVPVLADAQIDRCKELIDWLARISEYKRSALDRISAHQALRADTLIVSSAYQRLLDEQDSIDFDDLLVLACRDEVIRG